MKLINFQILIDIIAIIAFSIQFAIDKDIDNIIILLWVIVALLAHYHIKETEF